MDLKEEIKIKARLFRLNNKDFERSIDELFEEWGKYKDIKWS